MQLRSILVLLLVAAVPLAAAPITFQTSLSGPAEEPPNASPGTGFATVTIDPIAHTLRVEVTFAGLLGTTTASHIHVINGPGDANTLDTNGPVATTTPSFVGFPLGVTSGSMDQTYDLTLNSSFRAGWITDSGGTAALAEQQLLAGLLGGRAYLNIHSSVFGGGEIRGFLDEAVPEPATVGLAGAALVGLFLVRRRFVQ